MVAGASPALPRRFPGASQVLPRCLKERPGSRTMGDEEVSRGTSRARPPDTRIGHAPGANAHDPYSLIHVWRPRNCRVGRLWKISALEPARKWGAMQATHGPSVGSWFRNRRRLACRSGRRLTRAGAARLLKTVRQRGIGILRAVWRAHCGLWSGLHDFRATTYSQLFAMIPIPHRWGR